jgi:protein-tyrosine-phosphatase/N-acetylglutamate synthase-like GNAT family acetyltransferase
VTRPRVVFLCVANSARSQMAEALARERFRQRLRIESAGSRPAPVHPVAIEVMHAVELDISAHRSKRVDDIDPTGIELVITLCAEEVCPAIAGSARRLHWPFEDPAAAAPSDHVPDELAAVADKLIAARRQAPFRVVRDRIAMRLDAIEPMLATPRGTAIAPATTDDRAAVEALLVGAQLPLDGLDAVFPDGFAIARLDGEIVGTAGIERYGWNALLRSVVVLPAHRGKRIADALVADRVSWARTHGAQAVSLLTTAADRYFERLGFVRIDRSRLPEQLRHSTQLAIPACSTAVAMMRRLVDKTTEDRLDDEIAAELAAHGTLLPPWRKYPDIPRRSIGWRMGSGEWYVWAWQRWWHFLDTGARTAYLATWATDVPPTWQGWLPPTSS